MSLTATQHKTRSRGIGGSDAAAAVGLSKYKTPVTLYLEKIGDIDDEEASEGPRYWGGMLEDIVATEYVKRTGNKVRRRRQAFVHPEYDWMLAHVDRTVDRKNTVLECKTSTDWLASNWGPDGSDQVPDEYLIQVQHQLACTGYGRADLAVLIGNRDYRIYHIGPDKSLINTLIEREHEFWRHVMDRIPPPPTNVQDLLDLYPSDSGGQVLADEALVSEYQDLKRVRDEIKQLEAQKKDSEQIIKTALADAAELVDDEGRVLASWKTSKPSKVFDTTTFKNEHPDLYDQFTIEKPGTRRFLVK